MIGLGLVVLVYYFRQLLGFGESTLLFWMNILFLGGVLAYGGVKLTNTWINWRYDEWIVTDQRIIDYDQHFLFSKDVGATNLDKIEDITFYQQGILSTFFNYGILDVQTAAQAVVHGQKTLLLDNVPHPEKVQRIIYQAIEEDRKRRMAAEPQKPANPLREEDSARVDISRNPFPEKVFPSDNSQQPPSF